METVTIVIRAGFKIWFSITTLRAEELKIAVLKRQQ